MNQKVDPGKEKKALQDTLLSAIETISKGDLKAQKESINQLRMIKKGLVELNDDLGGERDKLISLYDKVLDESERSSGFLRILAKDAVDKAKKPIPTLKSLVGGLLSNSNPVLRVGLSLVQEVKDYASDIKDRAKAEKLERLKAIEQESSLLKEQGKAVEDAVDSVAAAVQEAVQPVADEVKKSNQKGKDKQTKPRSEGPMVAHMRGIKEAAAAQTDILTLIYKTIAAGDEEQLKALEKVTTAEKPSAVTIDDTENSLHQLKLINDSLDVIIKQNANFMAFQQAQLVNQQKEELQSLVADRKSKATVEAPKLDKVDPDKGGFLSSFLPEMFGEIIGNALGGKKGLIGSVLSLLGSGLKKGVGIGLTLLRPSTWPKLVGGAIDFFKGGGSILKGLGSVAKESGALIKAGAGIAKNGLKFVPVIGEVVMVVSSLFDAFDGWSNAEKILGKTKVNLWDKASAAIGSMVGGLFSIFDMIAGLFGFDTKIGETITKGVAGFLDTIPDFFVKAKDFVIGKVTDKFEEIGKVFDAFSTSFVDGVKAMAVEIIKSLPGGELLLEGASWVGDKLGISGGSGKENPDLSARGRFDFNVPNKLNANEQEIEGIKKKGDKAAGDTNNVNNVKVDQSTTIVNNAPLFTRNSDDSHRLGLKMA